MSSEIATWGMIRSKVPSFPAPAAGRENECLTKSEILSQSGQDAYVGGSYGDTECTRIDDVRQISGYYLGTFTPLMDNTAYAPNADEHILVTVENNVATITFENFYVPYTNHGMLKLKVTIENGKLKDVITTESYIISPENSRIEGHFNGVSCDINYSYTWVGLNLGAIFTGTKQ